jgi:hypothetical protein
VGPCTTNADVCAQELGSLPEGAYFVLLEDLLRGGDGAPVYHKNGRGISVFPLGILGGEPERVRFPDKKLVVRISSSCKPA